MLLKSASLIILLTVAVYSPKECDMNGDSYLNVDDLSRQCEMSCAEDDQEYAKKVKLTINFKTRRTEEVTCYCKVENNATETKSKRN